MKIAFFTTTRAELGIMSSFIRQVEENPRYECLLFVGGTHLKEEYGYTINEIKKVGHNITDTFDYIQDGDSAGSIAKSAGYCTIEVTRLFQEYNFDVISILGDRYELVPIALTAILFNKPIIHWGGGEFTKGVIDNQIRHMLTKASHVHFVAAEQYAENIVKMGEDPSRICITGSPVIDSFKMLNPTSKNELFIELGLEISRPIVLLTYHPVTIEFKCSPLEQIKNLFESIKRFNYQVVITSPNLERDSKVIIDYIKQQVNENPDLHYFESLGAKRYHSLLTHCSFVIGNSSSGIFEAPYFKVPTVNIGDRQMGRYLHRSIVEVGYSVKSIIEGIHKVESLEFLESIKTMKYEFGDGNATEKAIKFLDSLILDSNFIRK